jgi:hypothetical protein
MLLPFAQEDSGKYISRDDFEIENKSVTCAKI